MLPGVKKILRYRGRVRSLSEIRPSSSSPCTPNWALCENLAEDRIVFTFINVMDTDMSIQATRLVHHSFKRDTPQCRERERKKERKKERKRETVQLTVEDCLAEDIYAADRDRRDIHSLASYAPDHAASFHSCA
jgi:hypothetical protein